MPFVLDLVHNAQDRQAITFHYAGPGIGRPFVAPLDLPPGRLKMLRDAFDATMKASDFIADATRQQLVLMPESGADLAALIDKIYKTAKPIVEKISKLVN